MNKLTTIAAMAALLMSTPSYAVTLVNGDFSEGLSGWSTTTTDNGRTLTRRTVLFETVAGVESSAAQYQVGRDDFLIGGNHGIILSQEVASDYVGLATVSVDVAADNTSGGANSSAGLFRLLVNSTEIASNDFSAIRGLTTERAMLSGEIFLDGAAPVTVELWITRPFDPRDTLSAYVDNFEVVTESAQPVPLPPSVLMLGSALALCGLASYRRRTAT